eukprot:scaffold250956_cov35-Tisochrysis_lutea.AAC.2
MTSATSNRRCSASAKARLVGRLNWSSSVSSGPKEQSPLSVAMSETGRGAGCSVTGGDACDEPPGACATSHSVWDTEVLSSLTMQESCMPSHTTRPS